MLQNLLHNRMFKGIALTVLVTFLATIPAETGYAQLVMPKPGQMVPVTSRFTPTLTVGLRLDPKDPFNLYFVMSNGEKTLDENAKREEYSKLIKYFMASLVTPNNDMWVNLSPKEAERIIPDNFSMTEMGRDLLAQDYLLKQFTASLMAPDGETGKVFWKRVYEKAYEIYGTTDIPVDTFNKVWITADKADIYQKGDTAFLVDSHLKVMLEQDFMAVESNKDQFSDVLILNKEAETLSRDLAADIVRKVIVPEIEREVNQGSNFAQVRQIYNAMILATWFKDALRDTLLGQVYADQSKVAGIAIDDPQMKDRIYREYLEAYKTGVFNYIREEMDAMTRELLPRRYFAGGMVAVDKAAINTDVSAGKAADAVKKIGKKIEVAAVRLKPIDPVGNELNAVTSKGPVDAAQKGQDQRDAYKYQQRRLQDKLKGVDEVRKATEKQYKLQQAKAKERAEARAKEQARAKARAEAKAQAEARAKEKKERLKAAEETQVDENTAALSGLVPPVASDGRSDRKEDIYRGYTGEDAPLEQFRRQIARNDLRRERFSWARKLVLRTALFVGFGALLMCKPGGTFDREPSDSPVRPVTIAMQQEVQEQKKADNILVIDRWTGTQVGISDTTDFEVVGKDHPLFHGNDQIRIFARDGSLVTIKAGMKISWITVNEDRTLPDGTRLPDNVRPLTLNGKQVVVGQFVEAGAPVQQAAGGDSQAARAPTTYGPMVSAGSTGTAAGDTTSSFYEDQKEKRQGMDSLYVAQQEKIDDANKALAEIQKNIHDADSLNRARQEQAIHGYAQSEVEKLNLNPPTVVDSLSKSIAGLGARSGSPFALALGWNWKPSGEIYSVPLGGKFNLSLLFRNSPWASAFEALNLAKGAGAGDLGVLGYLAAINAVPKLANSYTENKYDRQHQSGVLFIPSQTSLSRSKNLAGTGTLPNKIWYQRTHFFIQSEAVEVDSEYVYQAPRMGVLHKLPILDIPEDIQVELGGKVSKKLFGDPKQHTSIWEKQEFPAVIFFGIDEKSFYKEALTNPDANLDYWIARREVWDFRGYEFQAKGVKEVVEKTAAVLNEAAPADIKLQTGIQWLNHASLVKRLVLHGLDTVSVSQETAALMQAAAKQYSVDSLAQLTDAQWHEFGKSSQGQQLKRSILADIAPSLISRKANPCVVGIKHDRQKGTSEDVFEAPRFYDEAKLFCDKMGLWMNEGEVYQIPSIKGIQEMELLYNIVTGANGIKAALVNPATGEVLKDTNNKPYIYTSLADLPRTEKDTLTLRMGNTIVTGKQAVADGMHGFSLGLWDKNDPKSVIHPILIYSQGEAAKNVFYNFKTTQAQLDSITGLFVSFDGKITPLQDTSVISIELSKASEIKKFFGRELRIPVGYPVAAMGSERGIWIPKPEGMKVQVAQLIGKERGVFSLDQDEVRGLVTFKQGEKVFTRIKNEAGEYEEYQVTYGPNLVNDMDDMENFAFGVDADGNFMKFAAPPQGVTSMPLDSLMAGNQMPKDSRKPWAETLSTDPTVLKQQFEERGIPTEGIDFEALIKSLADYQAKKKAFDDANNEYARNTARMAADYRGARTAGALEMANGVKELMKSMGEAKEKIDAQLNVYGVVHDISGGADTLFDQHVQAMKDKGPEALKEIVADYQKQQLADIDSMIAGVHKDINALNSKVDSVQLAMKRINDARTQKVNPDNFRQGMVDSLLIKYGEVTAYIDSLNLLGKMIENPSGIKPEDISYAYAMADTAAVKKAYLGTLGQSQSALYHIPAADINDAITKRTQAQNDLQELQAMVADTNFTNIGNYILTNAQIIDQNMNALNQEVGRIGLQDIPYWKAELAKATLVNDPGWIAVAQQMLDVLNARVLEINRQEINGQPGGLLWDIEKDRQLLINGPDSEPIESIVARKIAIRQQEIAYYDSLVDALNAQNELVVQDWGGLGYLFGEKSEIQEWITALTAEKDAIGILVDSLQEQRAQAIQGQNTAWANHLDNMIRLYQQRVKQIEELIIPDFKRDIDIIDQVLPPEAPAVTVARKMAVEDAKETWYRSFGDLLKGGIGLAIPDWSKLGDFIPSQQEITDGLAYWPATTEKTAQDVVYWQGRLAAAQSILDTASISFTNKMLGAINKKLTSEGLIISNLSQDQKIHDGTSNEALELFKDRKMRGALAEQDYLASMADAIAAGMDLKVTDLTNIFIAQSDSSNFMAYWTEDDGDQEAATTMGRLDRIDQEGVVYWQKVFNNENADAGTKQLAQDWISNLRKERQYGEQHAIPEIKQDMDFQNGNPNKETVEHVIERKTAAREAELEYLLERVDLLKRTLDVYTKVFDKEELKKYHAWVNQQLGYNLETIKRLSGDNNPLRPALMKGLAVLNQSSEKALQARQEYLEKYDAEQEKVNGTYTPYIGALENIDSTFTVWKASVLDALTSAGADAETIKQVTVFLDNFAPPKAGLIRKGREIIAMLPDGQGGKKRQTLIAIGGQEAWQQVSTEFSRVRDRDGNIRFPTDNHFAALDVIPESIIPVNIFSGAVTDLQKEAGNGAGTEQYALVGVQFSPQSADAPNYLVNMIVGGQQQTVFLENYGSTSADPQGTVKKQNYALLLSNVAYRNDEGSMLFEVAGFFNVTTGEQMLWSVDGKDGRGNDRKKRIASDAVPQDHIGIYGMEAALSYKLPISSDPNSTRNRLLLKVEGGFAKAEGTKGHKATLIDPLTGEEVMTDFRLLETGDAFAYGKLSANVQIDKKGRFNVVFALNHEREGFDEAFGEIQEETFGSVGADIKLGKVGIRAEKAINNERVSGSVTVGRFSGQVEYYDKESFAYGGSLRIAKGLNVTLKNRNGTWIWGVTAKNSFGELSAGASRQGFAAGAVKDILSFLPQQWRPGKTRPPSRTIVRPASREEKAIAGDTIYTVPQIQQLLWNVPATDTIKVPVIRAGHDVIRIVWLPAAHAFMSEALNGKGAIFYFDGTKPKVLEGDVLGGLEILKAGFLKEENYSLTLNGVPTKLENVHPRTLIAVRGVDREKRTAELVGSIELGLKTLDLGIALSEGRLAFNRETREYRILAPADEAPEGFSRVLFNVTAVDDVNGLPWSPVTAAEFDPRQIITVQTHNTKGYAYVNADGDVRYLDVPATRETRAVRDLWRQGYKAQNEQQYQSINGQGHMDIANQLYEERMIDFLEHNFLVRRKDGTSEFLTLEQINDPRNRVLQDSKEVLQKNMEDEEVGRVLKLYGGAFELIPSSQMDRFLKQHWMLVWENKDGVGQGVEYITMDQLKDPAVYKRLVGLGFGAAPDQDKGKSFGEIKMQDRNENVVGRIYLSKNMRKSKVELITGNTSKIYKFLNFDGMNPKDPVAQTVRFDDENGLRHVITTDLLPVNKLENGSQFSIEEVYDLGVGRKEALLRRINNQRAERVEFKDGHERYAVSTDPGHEKGQKVVVDGILRDSVIAVYEFDEKTNIAYSADLRNFRDHDGYIGIRVTEYDGDLIVKDETGFVKVDKEKLARGELSADDILKIVKEQPKYLMRDTYHYDGVDPGIPSVRNVELQAATGVWGHSWDIKGTEYNAPRPELVSVLQQNPVIAGVFKKYGISPETELVESYTQTVQNVRTTDYRIPDDVQDKKFITVREEAGRVIEIIVGLEFDSHTGEQTLSYQLTPDYQIKSLMRTVKNDKTIDEILPGNIAAVYQELAGRRFAMADENFWGRMEMLGIGRNYVPVKVQEIPFLVISDTINKDSYKSVEPRVQALIMQYQATGDPKEREDILRQIQDVVREHTRNTAHYSSQQGKPIDHYLIPNDSRGRDIAVEYSNGEIGLSMWWFEGSQMTVVNGEETQVLQPINILPGVMVVDKDGGKLQRSILYKHTELVPVYDLNKQQQDINGNFYYVLDAEIQNTVVYSPGGQLLLEEYDYVRNLVVKGQLGKQIKGNERIYYDIYSPFVTPVLGVHIESSRITKVVLDSRKSADGTDQLSETVSIITEPTAPEIRHVFSTQYRNGVYVDQSRIDFKGFWGSLGVVLGSMWLVGMILQGIKWIQFGHRRKKIGKGVEDSIAKTAAGSGSQPSGSQAGQEDRENQARMNRIRDIIARVQQEEYDLGKDGTAKTVREVTFQVFTDPLERGETLESVWEKYTKPYRVWRKEVLGEASDFSRKEVNGREVEKTDEDMIRDLWLIALIFVGCDIFRSTPDYMSFLLHKSLALRDAGDGDKIGDLIRSEYTRWHKIVFLTNTTLKGIGPMTTTSNVMPNEDIFLLDDLNYMFLTPAFVKRYLAMTEEEKAGAYDALTKELQQKTNAVVNVIKKISYEFSPEDLQVEELRQALMGDRPDDEVVRQKLGLTKEQVADISTKDLVAALNKALMLGDLFSSIEIDQYRKSLNREMRGILAQAFAEARLRAEGRLKPDDRTLIIPDIKRLNRALLEIMYPQILKSSEKKKGLDERFNSEKLRMRARLVNMQEYKDYVKFVTGQWNAEQPLFFRVYTGKSGWLHIIRNVFSPYKPVFYSMFMAVGVTLALFFHMPLIGMAVAAGSVIAIESAGKLLDLWVDRNGKNFFRNKRTITKNGQKVDNPHYTVRPDQGYEAPAVDAKTKWFRRGFWAAVFGGKIAWNIFLMKYFFIPLSEMWGATWMFSVGSFTLPINLNWVLLAGVGLYMFVLMIVDTFSFYFMPTAASTFVRLSNAGVGLINTPEKLQALALVKGSGGKEPQGLSKDSEFVQLMRSRLIPKELGLSEEQEIVAVAEMMNLIVRRAYERYYISKEEYQANSWKIQPRKGTKNFYDKVVTPPEKFFEFKNEVIQKRMMTFATGLFMDFKAPRRFSKIRSLEVMIPVGPGEHLLYPYRSLEKSVADFDIDLDRKLDSGHTNLNLLIQRYPDMWMNFIVQQEGLVSKIEDIVDAMKRNDLQYLKDNDPLGKYQEIPDGDLEAMRQQIDRMKNLPFGEELGPLHEILELQVRIWGSNRFQAFARTLEGFSDYALTLQLLARMENPEASDEQINEAVNKKYTILWGHQSYGDYEFKDADGPKAQDTITLLKYFAEKGIIIDVSYLLNYDGKLKPEQAARLERGVDEKLSKGSWNRVLARYDINAPGADKDKFVTRGIVHLTPEFAIVGEGKPGNQLHTLANVGKESVLTQDMNADMWTEQTLLMPSLLEELNGPDISFVGYPEDIVSTDFNTIGQYSGDSDDTFVKTSRFHNNKLGSDGHYGHPDIWNTFSAFMYGGVSSVTKISEDIYGWYARVLRGQVNKFFVFIRGAKAREVALQTVTGLWSKFSMGCAQLTQDVMLWLVNTSPIFSFTRKEGHEFGGIGHYHKKKIVIIGLALYIVVTYLGGVSGFTAFPAEMLVGLFGMLLFAEAIVLTGATKWIQEKGMKILPQFLSLWLKMSPLYLASILTQSKGFQRGKDIAVYVATGRGFTRQITKLVGYDPTRKADVSDSKGVLGTFSRTHVVFGFIMSLLAAYGTKVWLNPTLAFSAPFVLIFICIMAFPIMTMRGSLPISGVKAREYVKGFHKNAVEGARHVGRQFTQISSNWDLKDDPGSNVLKRFWNVFKFFMGDLKGAIGEALTYALWALMVPAPALLPAVTVLWCLTGFGAIPLLIGGAVTVLTSPYLWSRLFPGLVDRISGANNNNIPATPPATPAGPSEVPGEGDEAQQVSDKSEEIVPEDLMPPVIQPTAEELATKARLQALLVKEQYLRHKVEVLEQQQRNAGILEEAEASKAEVPFGGIDMGRDHLTLNIKVDGEGMPLPLQLQDPVMVNIQGLSPEIRAIMPVSAANMPAFAELMK